MKVPRDLSGADLEKALGSWVTRGRARQAAIPV